MDVRRRIHAPLFVLVGFVLLAGCDVPKPSPTASEPAPFVMTVRGPIPPDSLGLTLPHEHVLVDFAGADVAGPGRYDRDEVFAVVRPYLDAVRALGGRSFVDATPAYLGRDPRLLRRLSDSTGLHVLASTGYYGARDDVHLPPHAFTEPADSLAARWIREWEEGLDGTDVRPGFIKIGVDPGPLSDVDRKLVQAAARAHLQTGLTIAAHTGPAAGALEELAVLGDEGVAPDAWIWVHAQAEADSTILVAAARRGAWISLDGLAPGTVDRTAIRLAYLRDQGVLHRVLVSHDAGWYTVGEPGGGDFRPYDTLFTALLPALRASGFTEAEIRQLTVANPEEALSVRVRRAGEG